MFSVEGKQNVDASEELNADEWPKLDFASRKNTWAAGTKSFPCERRWTLETFPTQRSSLRFEKSFSLVDSDRPELVAWAGGKVKNANRNPRVSTGTWQALREIVPVHSGFDGVWRWTAPTVHLNRFLHMSSLRWNLRFGYDLLRSIRRGETYGLHQMHLLRSVTVLFLYPFTFLLSVLSIQFPIHCRRIKWKTMRSHEFNTSTRELVTEQSGKKNQTRKKRCRMANVQS